MWCAVTLSTYKSAKSCKVNVVQSLALPLKKKKRELIYTRRGRDTVSRALSARAIRDWVKHGQMRLIHSPPPDTVLRRAPRSLGSALSGSDVGSKWWLLCSLLHPTAKHLNRLAAILVYISAVQRQKTVTSIIGQKWVIDIFGTFKTSFIVCISILSQFSCFSEKIMGRLNRNFEKPWRNQGRTP